MLLTAQKGVRKKFGMNSEEEKKKNQQTPQSHLSIKI